MIRYCIVLHQIATYCNGWHQSLPSCKRSWTRYWAVARSWTGCGSWARLRWSITEQWLERLLIYMSMIIYLYIYIVLLLSLLLLLLLLLLVLLVVLLLLVLLLLHFISCYIILYQIISLIAKEALTWPDQMFHPVSSCFIILDFLGREAGDGTCWGK